MGVERVVSPTSALNFTCPLRSKPKSSRRTASWPGKLACVFVRQNGTISLTLSSPIPSRTRARAGAAPWDACARGC
jgi:hypothetical protein